MVGTAVGRGVMVMVVLAWLGTTVGRHPELLAGSLHRFFALVLAVAAVLGVLYYAFVRRASPQR